MNEDFDEIFRKQFQGSIDEENKESEMQDNSSSEQSSPPPQEQAQKPESTNTKSTDDYRRKRIRNKFFSGIVHPKHPRKERKHGFVVSFFIGFANILIIIGIVVLVRTFLVSPFAVVGSSMESNLHNGNLILVDKITYRLSSPKRGDVIVFYPPVNRYSSEKGLLCTAKRLVYLVLGKDIETACHAREFYVKRVIATEGDEVEIKNRQVFVTPAGTSKRIRIREDFLDPKNRNNTCFVPSCNSTKDINGVILEVPEGTVYTLGDNRTGSSDSRAWKKDGKDVPFVPEENIAGKVRAVFWKPSDMKIVPRIDILDTEQK